MQVLSRPLHALFLGAALLLVLPAGPARGEGEDTRARTDPIPLGLEQAVERALDRSRHGLVRAGEAGGDAEWLAPARGRSLRGRFTPRGVRVEPAAGADDGAAEPWSFGLVLREAGRPGGLQAVESARRSVEENRIEYQRGGLVEWYRNGRAGIEQGFTLESPPPGDADQVELSLEVRGGFEGRVAENGRSAVFRRSDDPRALRYEGLRAWDSSGRELPARLFVRKSRLRVVVTDCDASYPIVIDPLMWIEQAKLTASDGQSSDDFGTSLSVFGQRAVVGAPMEDTAGSNAGAIYVFRRSGTSWSQEQKITALGAGSGDNFGRDVALSGSTLVSGSPLDDDAGVSSGSAHVWVRSGTTWSHEAKLTASDADGGDEFGGAVGIDGDTIIIGAERADGAAGVDPGAAYVFTRSGTVWTEQTILTAIDAAFTDNYGKSVDVSGDTAAIGTWHKDNLGKVDAGSIYVYTRSGTVWSSQGQVLASVPENGQLLGHSVDVDGDTLLGGAPGDDEEGLFAGAAFVFHRSGTVWSQQAKLTAADTTAGDQLGHSVGVSGELAVAGAFGDDDGATGAGSAYVFLRSGTDWSEEAKLTASDAALFDEFGEAVDVSGDTALVGAHLEDEMGSAAGAAYAYQLPEVPIAYCDGKTTSQDCIPYVIATGIASASSTDPFTIRGFDHVPGQAGLLIYGFKRGNLAFHGGKICIKAPTVRTTPKAGKAIASGTCPAGTTGRLSRNFNTVIQSGVMPMLTVGQRTNAQWLQRDPTNTIGGFGDNLSDGIEFTIAP